LGCEKIPITPNIGAPTYAGRTLEQTQATLSASMGPPLHATQQTCPHPAGAHWVPCRLGGGAPALEEAKALDAAARTDRAHQRADQNKTARKLIELSPRH
jgi:hypothetical protein